MRTHDVTQNAALRARSVRVRCVSHGRTAKFGRPWAKLKLNGTASQPRTSRASCGYSIEKLRKRSPTWKWFTTIENTARRAFAASCAVDPEFTESPSVTPATLYRKNRITRRTTPVTTIMAPPLSGQRWHSFVAPRNQPLLHTVQPTPVWPAKHFPSGHQPGSSHTVQKASPFLAVVVPSAQLLQVSEASRD